MNSKTVKLIETLERLTKRKVNLVEQINSLQQKSLLSVESWCQISLLDVLKKTNNQDKILLVIKHPSEEGDNFIIEINNQGVISCEGKIISIKDDFDKIVSFLIDN